MPSALQPSLDFPNEIWIEILTATVAEARPVLHYFDLKRVAGVSQKFKALIQSKIFDETLFRGGVPLSVVPPGTWIDLHPLIDYMNSGISSSIESFTMGKFIKAWDTQSYSYETQISTLASASEFASSPPVTTMSIHPGVHSWGAPLGISTGITVLDFLAEVARIWASPVDLSDAGSAVEGSEDDEAQMTCEEYIRKC